MQMGKTWGAFHSTKNSGLRFRKFHVANGTVNREIFRMVIPAQVDRAIPFSFGQKFPESMTEGYCKPKFFRMEQCFPIRTDQPKKAVHLERWTFFSEKFPVGQNRSIQFRTGISGNFGRMESAPEAAIILGLILIL